MELLQIIPFYYILKGILETEGLNYLYFIKLSRILNCSLSLPKARQNKGAILLLVLLVYFVLGSYFLGLAWYHISKMGDYSFISEYSVFMSGNVYQKVVALTYFISSSLSLVGLGDFHPVSKAEVLAATVLFLVAILYFVALADFLSSKFPKSQTYEKFFGILKKYNGG